jgi:N-acylneuraminate cytidylyltransferase
VTVYAIIPARGGSKGVPGKNLRSVAGHPLVAYSIAAARCCPRIDRVIVSTDSPEIAAICRRYGAETPFLRPPELAGDLSTDREFVLHALEWFSENEERLPDALVHLRPTTPLRDPRGITAGIDEYWRDGTATSLRSVHLAVHTPYKWFREESGYLFGLFDAAGRPGYANLPRQLFPPVYIPNGYVDVLRTEFVLSAQDIHGERIHAFVTREVPDLDTPADFEDVERRLERESSPLLPYLDSLIVRRGPAWRVRRPSIAQQVPMSPSDASGRLESLETMEPDPSPITGNR